MVWIALYLSGTFELKCLVRYASVVNDLAILCIDVDRKCEKSIARRNLYKYPGIPIFQRFALFRYSSEPCNDPTVMLRRRRRGKYYREFVGHYITYKRDGISSKRYGRFNFMDVGDVYIGFGLLYQCDVVKFDIRRIEHCMRTRRDIDNVLGYTRRITCMMVKCLRGNIKATDDQILTTFNMW